MKKKGEAGYIRSRKKQVILKTVLEFGVVIALLVLGILQTGNRLNLLTVVAVVGCLPAAKAMVEMIMILPHHTVSDAIAIETAVRGSDLTMVYDLVFTSEKKVMPVEVIAITGNTVCGFSSNEKLDTNATAEHMKQYLLTNQLNKVSVKIFANYAEFLKRIEEMNEMAKNEQKDFARTEDAIRRVILNISL